MLRWSPFESSSRILRVYDELSWFYWHRFSVGPRANLWWSKRFLGSVRRWINLQLQSLHWLQRGQPHVLREHLFAPSEPGDAELSRYLRQLPHRSIRQVNGNLNQPPDGRKERRMDETTNVRGANVKRERWRETRIYISDFPNYLLHFTI